MNAGHKAFLFVGVFMCACIHPGAQVPIRVSVRVWGLR